MESNDLVELWNAYWYDLSHPVSAGHFVANVAVLIVAGGVIWLAWKMLMGRN